MAAIIAAYVALTWKLQWWKSIRTTGFFHEVVDSAKRPWMRGPNADVRRAQALNVWLIQIIVALGPPLGALAFGIYMKTDWGISLFFLVPLAIIAIPALRVTQMALIRLLLIWAIFTFAMLLLSPIIAAQHIRQHGDAAAPFRPRSEFALQLTEAWRARFNTRWRIVAAKTESGDAMTFYSPDHPLTFTPGELWSSGLTTRGDLDKWGFVGICDTTDYELAKCEAWMKENAPDAEQLNITARRYFHGKAGPTLRWKVWIKGPPRPEADEG
jgi:hypothetical protein